MRGSYSGNTSAFQADAESSILLPRSKLPKNSRQINNYLLNYSLFFKTLIALVVKLVDTLVLEASALCVTVRVRPRAPIYLGGVAQLGERLLCKQ